MVNNAKNELITNENFPDLGYDKKTGHFYWMQTGVGRKMSQPVGTANNDGYLRIGYKYNRYFSHRLAFFFVYGYMPLTVDHVNHIKNDNRISNLREASYSQQVMNRPKAKGKTSQYLGVNWDKSRGKWSAEIKRGGRYFARKRFDCEHEAARWRDEKAAESHGEFVTLNEV